MMYAFFAAALALQAAVPQPKFDSGRAWEHLRQLVAIGPRPSGSPAIEQTRKYIKEKLAAEGLTAAEQVWDEPTASSGWGTHRRLSTPCAWSISSSRSLEFTRIGWSAPAITTRS